MKRPLLALLLLVSTVALGHVIGQSHLHITHDGHDTNGQPTILTQFTVYCTKDDGSQSVTYPVYDTMSPAVTISELGLTDGYWNCHATATNAAAESNPSEVLSFLLVGGVKINPSAPVAPSLTIEDN